MNARQLLERHRAHALTAIAERLADTGLEVADLRSLGVEDVLRIYGDACARVAEDCDTAEIPIGTWDDETTEPYPLPLDPPE